MKTNKDTTKAVEAVTTLIKYCDRYKHCKGCIFHDVNSGCMVNYPYRYHKIKGVKV